MRKKKMSTMQPEVEAKEVIIEEAVVQEAENKAPEEITEEQGEKKAGEEKPVPKRKKRAVKEKTTTVEAPKKRGRKPALDTAEKSVAGKEEEKIVLQFSGKEISTNDIKEQIKAAWVEQGHRAAFIKKLEIYIKPEECAAYYVINEKKSGKIDL